MSANGKGLDLSVPLDDATKAALLLRLEAQTEKTATCWLWRGCIKNQYGHGAISVHNRAVYVHQLAAAIFHGPLPKRGAVLHECDVPACWRPEHLKRGTQADNIADMEAKGRARKVVPRGERHHKVTLTNDQVAEIRARWAANPRDQRALAAAYGVRQSTIWRLVHKVTRAEASA